MESADDNTVTDLATCLYFYIFSFEKKQIESLIIAETFGDTKIEPHTNTEFGGGSGGGAGAGGEF